MEKENHLITERKAKIQAWKDKGFDGYAVTYDRTHTAAQARESADKGTREAPDVMGEPKSEARLCGRLLQMRDMGKLAFLRMRDGSGDFQICFAKQVLGDDFKWFLKNLDLGDYAGFEGEFFLTKHGEPTLMAVTVTPLAKAIRPLPEKFHGLTDQEACYRERNLDLATNPETFDRFKKRSQIVRLIREFFYNHNFDEVETPMLQAQAGGAMARTFETHHNTLDHDFHLRIALELPLKMVCSGGIERVFEIGKNFRNEGSDPSHLQEFTMIEWYGAYDTLELHESWIEDIIRHIGTDIFGKTEFGILDKEEQEVAVDFAAPFAKVTFAELLEKYANIDLFKASMEELVAKAKEVGVEEVENRGRGNLLDDIYKKTARPHLVQPTFVQDWPSDLKPLARPKGDGTSHVSQLVIAGWEVTNGYGELVDPTVQRQLLEEQQQAKNDGDDEAMEVDETFLKAMEHGFPPMAGNAIGIDRLCALLMGQPNLRDVVLFPTMKPEGKLVKAEKATQVATVILNTSALDEDWQAMNSVGHLAAAFGARQGEKLFYQDEITTQDGKVIKLNTTQAIMIKDGKDNQSLLKLKSEAESAGLHLSEFTREMIETSDDRKVASVTRNKKLEEVEFLGLLVYGKKSTVDRMTEEFDLLKAL